jgi:hypothetical protein
MERRTWAVRAEARIRHIPVHVYTLQSFLAGILTTDRPRLTDAVNAVGTQLELLDVVSAVYGSGTSRHYGDAAFVLKRSVFFICDRPAAGYRPEHAPIAHHHLRHHIALSCGPFFIEGRAHLPPGGNVEHKIFDSAQRFIPLTDATITSPDMPTSTEATVLVNRERIDYVIVNVISVGDILANDAPPQATRTTP